MKIEKPTIQDITDLLIPVGGTIVGIMLSGAVKNLIPPSMIESDNVKSAIIGGTGILTASAVKGKENGAVFVRSLGAGMTAKQVWDISSRAIQPVLPEKDGSTGIAFLHDLFPNQEVTQPAPEAVGAILGMGDWNSHQQPEFLANPGYHLEESIQFAT